MRARRSKLAEECLLRDLQQLGVYIKNPRLEVEIGVITHAITILNDSDSDKLCHEIRAISVRLRGYCEALRSQVGGTMDRGSLQVLFREIVMIERKVSAAHENLTARYERIYKIWRTRREQISNMLTLLDSVGSMKPQSYIKGLHVLIQQVDDSLESIRRMLNDQGETLKRYFNACKVLVAFISPQGNPPSGPVPPDNSGLSICNPDFLLSPPPGLTKAIESGKERLSQIDAVVGKARYTKARKAVEANISTTASQLESLHRNSQEYEWKFQGLPLSKPFHGIKLWNRWREPSRQLPNLVGIMTDALVKIQRGFDGYKESIVELIFRPLGNMTKDLKPYLSQIAQDIVGKRLHPDMILYEAAFVFLIKHVSQQFGLTEQVYDCRSRLETMLRKN
ncbi:hypothetical protein FRC18_011106 [Serendipita sp. 400]|nr:hypothetical protein FRC18_011106 [Serendipita sp. 400]